VPRPYLSLSRCALPDRWAGAVLDYGTGPTCGQERLSHASHPWPYKPRVADLAKQGRAGRARKWLYSCRIPGCQVQPQTKHFAIETEPVCADALTIAGIAIVAYILANVLHEGAGHGGACVVSGGKVLVISTVHMECSAETRLVMAGGTLMNVASGAFCFALGRITARTSPRLKYFMWLSMTVNLFTAAGYFAFSGIGGFGDWASFIQGLGPQWPWRIGMTIFGAAAYLLVARFSLLELRPLIGSDKNKRFARAVRLSKMPYLAGGILACLAGSLNPQGMILVALSAAASTFGGTSGLVWMMTWLKGDRIPLGSEAEPLPIRRSRPWIVTAFVLALVFIVVLGPGVRFASATAEESVPHSVAILATTSMMSYCFSVNSPARAPRSPCILAPFARVYLPLKAPLFSGRRGPSGAHGTCWKYGACWF
jgi:hypothetical protein